MRQLRCGAGRFDQWLDGDDDGARRAPSSAAPRCSSGAPAALPVPRGPAPHRRRVPQRGRDRPPSSPSRSRTATITAPRRASRRRSPTRRARRARFSDGDRHALPAAGARSSRAPSARRRCAAWPPTRASCTRGSSATLDQVIAFFDRGGDRAGGYPGHERARAARARAIASAPISWPSWARSRGPAPRRRPAGWRHDERRCMPRARPAASRLRSALRQPRGSGRRRAQRGDDWRRRVGRRPRAARGRLHRPRRPVRPTCRRPGTCGFDAPAFCETFESGAVDRRALRRARSRPLERRARRPLQPRRASTTSSASGPRSSAPAAPASRTPACSPTPTCSSAIRSRRSRAATSLATAAEQNYGLATYRDPAAVRLRGSHRHDQARHGSHEQRPRRLARADPRRRIRRPRRASTGRSAARARATASRSSSAPAGATRRTRSRRSSTPSPTTCRRRTSRRSTARSRTRPRRPTRSTTSRST